MASMGLGLAPLITSWQQATNRPVTGFLSNADAAALAYQAPTSPTPAPSPVPAPAPPPAPLVQTRFPITRSAQGFLHIEVSGEIVGGDADRFAYTVSTLTEAPLVILNSPGGEVENGLAIARLVYSKNLNTYAYERCASMCFVIFSAGHYRSFAPGTRIGVHSASTVSNRDPDDPFETDRSFTLTMEIVRTLQSFNRARPIPETILGKLVGRARNEIAILTPGDLMAMDAFMDPPSTLPVITPAVEQEAREGTAQQSGERVTQWINAYTNAYSRGMPPLYCDVNLPCLEGARDYAVTIGMEGIAAEAKRYADAIPKHVAPPIVPARTVAGGQDCLIFVTRWPLGIRRELRHAAPRVVRDHSVWFSCNSLGICNRKNIVTGSHLDSCRYSRTMRRGALRMLPEISNQNSRLWS